MTTKFVKSRFTKSFTDRPYKRKSDPKESKLEKKVRTMSRKMSQLSKGVETKWVGTYQGNTNVGNTTATLYASELCSSITLGDTREDRTGNRITLKYVDFNYLAINQVNTNTSTLRVWVLLDKEAHSYTATSGAFPTTFFLAATGAGQHYLSSYNPIFAKRFRVLHDEIHDLVNSAGNTSASAWGEAIPQVQRHRIHLKNYKVEYNDTNGGTVVDLEAGALWVFAASSQAVGTGSTLAYTATLCFTDS